jgi:NhaA family Na+:H+ antiporter
VAILCGIGFTMSLFIAALAFEGGGPAAGGLDRLGILSGSLVSAVVGYLLLKRALRGRSAAPPE